MRHALAAIEAALFFCGPCLLIAPLLEIRLGTLGEEDMPRALKLHARIVERRRNSTQKAGTRRAHSLSVMRRFPSTRGSSRLATC
jgi:hypothetical protein